jgi:hypothetical protein
MAGGTGAEPVLPPANTVTTLLAGVLGPAGALLQRAEDPHAELMALVWGPRFDREHAQALLIREEAQPPGALKALMAAADRFDRLPAPRQQHLRELIAQHRGASGRWDNPLHATHPAD